MTKGTLDEQLNFCFTIYDLNDDGYSYKYFRLEFQ